MNETIEYSPEKNDNVITIIKQPDGNYKGYMQKNGKFIEVRQGDPNTVLQMLLTAN